MLYYGKDFRCFFKHVVAIELDEEIKETIKDFDGAKSANCFYAYGYIDRERGFTFEVLASGKQSPTSGLYVARDGNDDVSVKIRAEMIEGKEIVFFNESRCKYSQKFQNKIESLKQYDVSDEIEFTRGLEYIDDLRDNYFIDDVMVNLISEENEVECCWVRINGFENNVFIGELLNEPLQDFGCKQGDQIAFVALEDTNGETNLFADMSVGSDIDIENKYSEAIEESVHSYKENPTEENKQALLDVLKYSEVYMPVHVETDDKTGEIIYIPDVVEFGDEKFVPIFSSIENASEYNEEYEIVSLPMQTAIELAKINDSKPSMLFLNGFTESFELYSDYWEYLEIFDDETADDENEELNVDDLSESEENDKFNSGYDSLTLEDLIQARKEVQKQLQKIDKYVLGDFSFDELYRFGDNPEEKYLSLLGVLIEICSLISKKYKETIGQ